MKNFKVVVQVNMGEYNTSVFITANHLEQRSENDSSVIADGVTIEFGETIERVEEF